MQTLLPVIPAQGSHQTTTFMGPKAGTHLLNAPRDLRGPAMGPRLRGGDGVFGGLPLNRPNSSNPANDAEIARKFETLIAETLLRSARAASLGDDGLGETGGNIRDMVDHQRAEVIARAAPLGVARLLARERSAAGGATQ